MKSGRSIILNVLLLTLAVNVLSQEQLVAPHSIEINHLRLFLSDNEQSMGSALQNYDRLIDRLERVAARKKSRRKLLRSIFFKVHQKSLVRYRGLATMDQTLKNGDFGCLTGTALYALILDHFGYSYQIIEKPNHVYMVVTLDGEKFLIESTLPDDGFQRILNPEVKTDQPEANFDRTNSLSSIGSRTLNVNSSETKSIGLVELAGLQFYNESIRLYLLGDHEKALKMVEEAYVLYPSQRNRQLMQLIINKILDYDLIKEEVKERYLNKYITLVKGKKISQTK